MDAISALSLDIYRVAQKKRDRFQTVIFLRCVELDVWNFAHSLCNMICGSVPSFIWISCSVMKQLRKESRDPLTEKTILGWLYRSALQRGAVQRCSTPRRYGRRRSLISKNNNSSKIFVFTYLVIQEYCQWDHCFVSKTFLTVFFQEEKHFLIAANGVLYQPPHNYLIQFSIGKFFEDYYFGTQ